MTTNNIDDQNEKMIDEISTVVKYVLNAIKYPDISEEIKDSKEAIFSRVVEKIDEEPKTTRTIRIRLTRKFAAVACAVSFLLILASTSYYMGSVSTNKLHNLAYVETFSPSGTTSKIELADGSIVILNSGSKLIYPPAFAGKERVVTISGEGFFEIAKDSERPFIVNSNNLSIKVLGTKFGFRAYEDEDHTIVTLKEGSVTTTSIENENVILTENHQLIVDNATGTYKRDNVDTMEFISWVDNILIFKENNLNEISKVLERKFNVQIQILSGDLKEERYSAVFKNGENVEQILKLLSHKRTWKYRYNTNGTIEIEK